MWGTCGQVSPLKALDFLLGSFDSDVVTMDYRVRGFTRDTQGKKHFMDHHLDSITDFIDSKLLRRYRTYDVNFERAHLFHTKMVLKTFRLNDYLFDKEESFLSDPKKKEVSELIQNEMEEIFRSKNGHTA